MELQRLGKYEIVAKIGQGGMGEVYRGIDPVLNRQVAIKTMMTDVGTDEALRKRFLREAQSSALLNHPNIVTVFDFGEEQGRMYIVMELLEGTDLKQIIQAQRLPLDDQIGLIEHICDGVAFAHAKGVVHRDLKPANIHVTPAHAVKIMDFGLARIASSDLTRAGVIMGTPHYMSPEQVRGEAATARSDVFSLGAVFHELLSGSRAFEGESMPSIMFNVMQSQPRALEALRPEIPRGLAETIRKALEKDPGARYADAGELGQAIRRARTALHENRAPRATSPPAPATTPAPTPVPHDSSVPVRLAATGASATDLSPVAELTDPTQVQSRTAPRIAQSHAPTPPAPAPPTTRLPAILLGLAAASLVVAVTAISLVVWYVQREPLSKPSAPPTVAVSAPPTPAPTPIPSASPQAEISLARQALAERDYRRAVALAQQADPVAAGPLIEQAEQALGESEALAARVRQALKAGDGAGASKALSQLVAHDPRHPEIAALTKGLETSLSARPRPTAVAVAPAPAPTPTALPTPQPAPSPTLAQQQPVAPPPRPPSPEDAIRSALLEYQQACARVDSVAIRRVFPLIRDDNLKAIAKMKRYDVRFDALEIHLEGERLATVNCTGLYVATPRDDKRAPSRFEGRQTIRLEKVSGSWVIRSIS